jgi:hypothetical protein
LVDLQYCAEHRPLSCAPQDVRRIFDPQCDRIHINTPIWLQTADDWWGDPCRRNDHSRAESSYSPARKPSVKGLKSVSRS